MTPSSRVYRILVVDDDDDIVVNLQDILIDLGYCADIASNGADALTLVDAHLYDVALVDFQMPGMDGALLCQKIRARSETTVTFMITAEAKSDGIKRAMEAGTVEVLRKPVDMKRLLPLIQQATTSSRP
ncbi:Transcriptional activator protein CzcR [Rubripirellula obstinata]|uniref:Transcriptional activator protein CzcR n=1 Tax=Rubripirellula obstinata TaxID=406547 RepID=A0A5B1CIM1_9BACT|nr:response regulator [Rubripirellula obstinata]KAA1259273.1 Transcriptional activator protein CzcR [Rubripirellula obstinata]